MEINICSIYFCIYPWVFSLNAITTKLVLQLFQFKSKGGSQVKEYCTALTKEDCRRQSGSFFACEKVGIATFLVLVVIDYELRMQLLLMKSTYISLLSIDKFVLSSLLKASYTLL